MTYRLPRQTHTAAADQGTVQRSVGATSRTQRYVDRRSPDELSAVHAKIDAAWARGPVQLQADGHSGLDDDQLREAAGHGISGGGGTLPHLDAIQRSFGPHDVSGVRAHVGGAAAEASGAMGANGYATGNDVAFAQSPSLFLAAHEAAHVVQQRAGVQLSSAVGQAGDSYEQQADAVAARVVAGESAADLLGAPASGGGAAVQRDATQEASGTVPTQWYLDFRGAGAHGRTAAHKDRQTGDVLRLENFKVGQDDQIPKFKEVGNALKSGVSHLGNYDHPVGDGRASGFATYHMLSELHAHIEFGNKPTPGEAKVAQGFVETILREHLADVFASEHGNWDQVRAYAATRVEQLLPGSKPTVTFDFGNTKQEGVPIDPVAYKIKGPAKCLAKVWVPTNTTYTTWDKTVDTSKRKHDDNRQREEGHAAVGSRTTTDDKSHVDNSSNGTADGATVANTRDKDKKSVDVTFTRDHAYQLALDIADDLVSQIRFGFNSVKGGLNTTTGAGIVEAPESAPEKPGLWDRAKGWLKDKAIDGVNKVKDIAVDAVAKVAKSKITKVITKGIGRIEWWMVPIGWGLDWIGDKAVDKIKSKLHIEKSADQKPPGHTVPIPTIPGVEFPTWSRIFYDQHKISLDEYVQQMHSEVGHLDIKDRTITTLQGHWEHEHDASRVDTFASHGDAHHGDSDDKRRLTETTLQGSGGKTTDHGDSTDDSEHTTVTTHGTTAHMTVGKPLMDIDVTS